MTLSDLAAYAAETYGIKEQHKWADFPGFSVLVDPHTEKWAALLMRRWDPETGSTVELCDLKCGRDCLVRLRASYLSAPFRMQGQKWVGVRFDRRTDPAVVFRLFDRAVTSGEQRGYTVSLGGVPNAVAARQETLLPAYGGRRLAPEEAIPPRIREMLKLYEPGNGSFLQKCKIFYLQGKSMEDYTDDRPWEGKFRHYFPTYHDLNVPQLRGYFTWRTGVRRGEFQKVPASFAYLYLYELLNGIGTDSPEDALEKMKTFETGYLDAGIGEADIRENLHRWMLEYAVLHGIPPAVALRYTDPALLAQDEALLILQKPEERTDGEVFGALVTLAGPRFAASPVITKCENGPRLFAASWRTAQANYKKDDKDLFRACFGRTYGFPWHPLANAVYWDRRPVKDADYCLTACRRYLCRGGTWREERYEPLYFDKKRFSAFLHETDRLLRRYLKTGHDLKERPEEAWASVYVRTVIEADKAAAAEAARPRITLDLSGLERIRKDAQTTRDSLLTEAELDLPGAGGMPDGPAAPTPVPAAAPAAPAAVPDAPAAAPAAPDAPEADEGPLDAVQKRILAGLLRGEDVLPVIRAEHLMPALAADMINELLFDEIGDTVLDCDGDRLSVVEDYREDLERLPGLQALLTQAPV